MHNHNNIKDLIESISASKGNELLELLDYVKSEIADARNGDESTESRKLAITMIDKMLYNKVKSVLKPDTKKETFFSDMI